MTFDEFRAQYEKVPVEEYPNGMASTMPAPLLSVKVSTYQHAAYIGECLDAILAQKTTFPFEIVIGEDESSDGTREICIEYTRRYPDQIRLLLHSRSNNILLNGRPTAKFQSTYTRFVCRGKYIASCEGDDYWTDDSKLERQVAYMEAHPDCVLTYHAWVKKLEANLDENTHEFQHADEALRPRRSPLTLTTVYRNVLTDLPSEMFSSENGDVWIKTLLRLNGRFHCIDEIQPAVYRIHGKSMFSSRDRLTQAKRSFYSRVGLIPYVQGSHVEQSIETEMVGWYLEMIRTMVSGQAPFDRQIAWDGFKILKENRLVKRMLFHAKMKGLVRELLPEFRRNGADISSDGPASGDRQHSSSRTMPASVPVIMMLFQSGLL